MTHENAMLPGNVGGPPGPAAPVSFDAAIRAVGELAMALSSAISDVDFAEAVRLRGELERALSRAADLTALTDPEKRGAAMQQLVVMQHIARRLFEMVPAPSAGAITAANAGDRTVLDREEQAWIADRLASGTNPRIQRPRRARSDTRPDSPRARAATRTHAINESARAVVEPPPSDEDGPR